MGMARGSLAVVVVVVVGRSQEGPVVVVVVERTDGKYQVDIAVGCPMRT